MASILIMDDDKQFRLYLQEILSDEGYQVVAVANGLEGVRLLEFNSFDMVISDIFMPEMDGIEAIRKVHKRNPQVKIIAISGGGVSISAFEVLPTAEILGANVTLIKPFTKRDLLPVVEDLLGECASN